MKQDYIFYDIESTGLNTCFDQVLQFAAIVTDHNLEEKDRIEIQVKHNADVIPSLGASLTHMIGPKDFCKGMSEYEGVRKIHQLLNTPNCISIGYNTLGYDDECLRFAFYRNLLNPYSHQYANGCYRMDIYPMTLFYYLFAPEVLDHWPKRNDLISLKLEDLSRENQLATGMAHDAMVDVEATVALARKFHKNQAVWRYLSDYFIKQQDQMRIASLPDATSGQAPLKYGLLVQGTIGRRDNFIAPVVVLGQHQHYRNQTLLMRLDTEGLESTTAGTIEETPWVIRKKIAEPGFLLPPSARFIEKLSPERLALMEKNIDWLKDNPALYAQIQQHYQQAMYPEYEGIDIGTSLYQQGFMSSEDQKASAVFHQAPWPEKAASIENFSREDLRVLAARIIGRYDASLLSGDVQEEFEAHLQKVFHNMPESQPKDFRNRYQYGLCDLEQEMAHFQDQDLSPEQHLILSEFKNWVKAQAGQTQTV